MAKKSSPSKKSVTARKRAERGRCWWCGEDPLYVKYHDEEWGVPVRDDQKMFEMLLLESFQAGLSWITILRKRQNFRRAFANFNPKKIARFTETDYRRLMKDAGIIRNQLKIRAAITNAQKFLELQKEFGSFCKYIWSFTNHRTLRSSRPRKTGKLPATSPESDRLSKDLKKRGFKFVGSTVIYAHMQATGMVDDHVEGCFKCRVRTNRPTRRP